MNELEIYSDTEIEHAIRFYQLGESLQAREMVARFQEERQRRRSTKNV